MYADSDLEKEVREIVEGGGDDELPKALIVDKILAQKTPESDADFFGLCARAHTEDAVRRFLNRYRGTAKADIVDPQLILPGFERLQRFYLVERRDAQVLVPVEHLSDAELERKAVDYVAMGDGCHEHARELRRYVLARSKGD